MKTIYGILGCIMAILLFVPYAACLGLITFSVELPEDIYICYEGWGFK